DCRDNNQHRDDTEYLCADAPALLRLRTNFGGTQHRKTFAAIPRRLHPQEFHAMIGGKVQPCIELRTVFIIPITAFALFEPHGGALLDVVRSAHGSPLKSARSPYSTSASIHIALARYSFTVCSPMPMRCAISARESPSTRRRSSASRQRGASRSSAPCKRRN